MTKKKASKKSATKKKRTKKTCGDYGGKRPDGKLCIRLAGWGTKRKTGRCKDHSSGAHAKMQAIKKSFLKLLEGGMHATSGAAKAAGVDHSTIWRWRQTDLGFDQRVIAALEKRDDIRNEIVENAFFKRCVEGNAPVVGTIFWLINRVPERWKDRKEISGPDGGPIGILNTYKVSLPDNERDS